MRSSLGFISASTFLLVSLFSLINASPALHLNTLEPRKGGRGGGGGGGGSRGGSGGHDETGGSGGSTGKGNSGGSGTSSTNLFVFSSGDGYGSLRSSCSFGDDHKCYGQDQTTGNGITCNGQGTWYTLTASNISVACAQFNYNSSAYSQGQSWNQTATNDGGSLVNEQGKQMSIYWTAQFDEADNATPAACEGALGDLVTACAGTNKDSEGGLYNFAGNTAAYAVNFTSQFCGC